MSPETKHTPGPWMTNSFMGSVSTPSMGDVGISEVFSDTQRIALVSEPHQLANARLIAAAPDLFAAAALMVALEDTDAPDADTRWKDARHMMRAAIAKAEDRG